MERHEKPLPKKLRKFKLKAAMQGEDVYIFDPDTRRIFNEPHKFVKVEVVQYRYIQGPWESLQFEFQWLDNGQLRNRFVCTADGVSTATDLFLVMKSKRS